MPDGTLIEPPAKSVVHATAKFAEYAATQAMGKEKLHSAMNKAILTSPKALRSAVFDALNIQKAMKKSLRHIKDVVEIRTNRIITEWSGGAVELMRELQYEYHTQYINYMTFQAKEKATKDLNLIDAMRRSLGAAGLVGFDIYLPFPSCLPLPLLLSTPPPSSYPPSSFLLIPLPSPTYPFTIVVPYVSI